MHQLIYSSLSNYFIPIFTRRIMSINRITSYLPSQQPQQEVHPELKELEKEKVTAVAEQKAETKPVVVLKKDSLEIKPG